MSAEKRYQDYVIKDGEFIGKFEEMYANCSDPWRQSEEDIGSLSRQAGVIICERLRQRLGLKKFVEIGCGFGRYTDVLTRRGLDVTGLDISASAITKAKELFPRISFEVGGIDDYAILRRLKPDAIVLSHLTWYVLPSLRPFLKFLRDEMPETMIFHIVSTFDRGEQKYGRSYFTNPEGIREYFGLVYYEWGEIHSPEGTDAYFLGSFSSDRLARWQPL
jgi:SAM-dependent methyltransferase